MRCRRARARRAAGRRRSRGCGPGHRGHGSGDPPGARGGADAAGTLVGPWPSSSSPMSATSTTTPAAATPSARPACRRCSTASAGPGSATRSCIDATPSGHAGRARAACTRPATWRCSSALEPSGGGRLDADTAMSAGVARGRAARRRRRPHGGRAASRPGRATRRVLRGAAAGPPRHPDDGRWGSASSTTSPSPRRRSPTRGERVLIVDYDAHHGNGTQDVFWADPRVAYVSLHQHPLYPGTGEPQRGGRRAGPRLDRQRARCRPAPPATCYRAGVRRRGRTRSPQSFAPTWLLLSAGFDAHRADPLTDLGLSAGDFGRADRRPRRPGPPGRTHRVPRGRLRPRGPAPAAPVPAWPPWSASASCPRRPRAAGPGRAEVAAAVSAQAAVETGVT